MLGMVYARTWAAVLSFPFQRLLVVQSLGNAMLSRETPGNYI
jgi:hypothetical protein